jgi:hypothetical protein
MVKPMPNFFLVSAITFGVFFAEALIHYNYGILETKHLPVKISNFTFPKGKSLLKMTSIVVIASVLSGAIVAKVEQKA